MVRSKPPSSKKPKRGGVDFKKAKRHVGRKVPAPKNATNTEIKFKAIILPEQTMVVDRTNMAVNKKGLTLRELLQQTSHHNSKIRKAALNGIRDLIMKHPLELKTHNLAIIEKLRERISDSDKAVREVLHNIFESVIFRSLKEDIKGHAVALLMAYIFNAMTDMTVEIRLSAFKFFKLLVHSYPSSFLMHSDKVLDHYMEILRNSKMYLQEKSELKSILGGLELCLSLFTNKEIDTNYRVNPQNKSTAEKRLLHAYRDTSEEPVGTIGCSSKLDKIENLIPVLVNCFVASMSLFCIDRDATGESFKNLSSILQCLYLALQALVQNSNVLKEDLGSSISVHLRKILEGFPFGLRNDLSDKGDEEFFILNVKIAEVFLLLGGWVGPISCLAGEFLNFIEKTLLDMPGVRLSKKKEDNLMSLLAYIPDLISHATIDWKERLLQAFTSAYKGCNVESKLMLGYLSSVGEMLLPEKVSPIPAIPDVPIRYRMEWVGEFPRILLHLGEKYVSAKEDIAKADPAKEEYAKKEQRLLILGQYIQYASAIEDIAKADPGKEEYAKKEQRLLILGQYIQVLLSRLLRVGQTNPPTSPLAADYDTIQLRLREFFNAKPKGIFVKIPRESQELAVFCLYYFSSLTRDILESISSCCLCEELDPVILFRIIEVLHSTYKAGRLRFSDHLGFLLTLISRFRVYPETIALRTLNQDPFRTLTGRVFTCLFQMGDGSLLLKILWGPLSDEISRKPALRNVHGLMRMVVALDRRLSKLSANEVNDLAGWMFFYMISSSIYLPKRINPTSESENTEIFKYLLKPCIHLFQANSKLQSLVLDLFNLYITGKGDNTFSMEPARRVQIAISVLIILHDGDVSARHTNHGLSDGSVKVVCENIKDLIESNRLNFAFDEMHELKLEFERLKTRVCTKL